MRITTLMTRTKVFTTAASGPGTRASA